VLDQMDRCICAALMLTPLLRCEIAIEMSDRDEGQGAFAFDGLHVS
jgi:hypothetical protein